MKKYVIVIQLMILSIFSYGQNENPFSTVGYEAPVMTEEKATDDTTVFIILNKDTAAIVRYLILDTKNHKIITLNISSQVLAIDSISPTTISRWFSPDAAHQHWSPYLTMGNKWSSSVDPDGNVDGKYEITINTDETGTTTSTATYVPDNNPYDVVVINGVQRFGFFEKGTVGVRTDGEVFGTAFSPSFADELYLPDYIGFNLGYSFITAGGAGQTYTYAWVKGEGFGVLNTANAGLGFDESISATVSFGNYHGMGKASFNTLKGLGYYANVGSGTLTGGVWGTIEKNNMGNFVNAWQGTTGGFSLGSTSLFGGSIGTTFTK